MAAPTQAEIIQSINLRFAGWGFCSEPVVDFGLLIFQKMQLITKDGRLGTGIKCEVHAIYNIYAGTQYEKTRLPLKITVYSNKKVIKIIGTADDTSLVPKRDETSLIVYEWYAK